MKLARILLLSAAAAALILAVVVGVAFTPQFQTWAARRAIASQPTLNLSIESVSAGLNHVNVRGLRLEEQGAVLTIPSLYAEFPLRAASRQDVQISRLVAKGWKLDLSKAEPLAPAKAAIAAAAPAARVFDGLFSQLNLPVDLAISGVDLEGEIIMRTAAVGSPSAGLTKLTVTGGGFREGREGKFSFKMTTSAQTGGASTALTASGTLAAVMDTPRTLQRLILQANATAKSPEFPTDIVLAVDGTAKRAVTGESYSLSINGHGRQYLTLQADFPPSGAKVMGGWKADIRDTDLAPFLAPFAISGSLPTFAADGEGEFEAAVNFDFVHLSGKLNVAAERLGGLGMELATLESIKVLSEFNVFQRGDLTRVEKLDVTVSAAKPVLAVRALQLFAFNAKTGDLTLSEREKDLMSIDLQGLPLAWLKPWLKPYTGELSLSGDDLTGAWRVSSREGGFAARPTTPAKLGHLSVARPGRPLVHDVDLSFELFGDYTPNGWLARVSDFEARRAGEMLLSVEAKAGRLVGESHPIKTTGLWSANLPALLAQPAAAAAGVALTGGRATGDFTASLGNTREIQAKVALTALAVDQKISAETLPDVTVETRLDIDPAGKITLSAPLLLERAGRKSDLTLNGTISPVGAGLEIDGHLVSQLLVVDDAQILAALLAAPTALTEPAKTAAPATRHPSPPWAGLRGKVALALKKVVVLDKAEVTAVGGTIRIDQGGLKLVDLRAALPDSGEISLSAGVDFDAKAAEPYALKADLGISNFDCGNFLRALEPAKLATVDGKFNVTTSLVGNGPNLHDLMTHARGRFEVNSKGGVFRALAVVLPADKLQAAKSALPLVGGLLNGPSANAINTATEITRILSEIPFDQLSLTAERDSRQNLILKDFTLIAPDVRLGGTGQVTYAVGKPLFSQAIDMQVVLGARGRLGELLGQVKLLKSEKDDLGYTALSAPIKLGGTLGKTDATEFKTRLLGVALEKSGVADALNKLLGGGK